MPSFTTSTHWPDYKVQTTEWNVEKGRWQLEDTDNMFYGIDKKNNVLRQIYIYYNYYYTFITIFIWKGIIMKLSANFQLSELVKSQVAERKGIPNNPSPSHIDNLKALCVNVLQPIRSHFDSPVIISSGYRSAELCIAIGSKPTSQHSEGKAADIEVVNVDNKELAEWIRNNLEFDQLILEFYREGEPDSGWIHVSWNTDHNRSQTLKAVKDENGKTTYQPW
jgi:zinc D-Ala-D-Ala carboxypeptidase